MKLFRFSLFTTFCTYLLLIMGGLVTSHEAGLAVPDWPLSYGQWMPPMVGNIFWEHGHRMIAGFVGILTLLLAIFMQFSKNTGTLKRLAWIALAAVILQAVLGGLTVIYMLPPPVSIFHACLGQTFFCLLIAITYVLHLNVGAGFPRPGVGDQSSGRGGLAPTDDGFNRAKRLFLVTTCLIYLQLVLGAIIRHTEFTVVPHIILGFIVLMHVVFIVRRVTVDFSDVILLFRIGLFLGFITVIQIFLGFGSFIYTRMLERGYSPESGEVFFTAAHHSVGALILGISFFLTLIV